MKVKVNVKTSPKAQEKYYEQAIAEAYAENERLYQENRDLERKIAILREMPRAMKSVISVQQRLATTGNSLAVEKAVELDEKCAAYADAMRTVRQRENLIDELNDQIAASESELKHANEVIMSINEQLERTESSNVAYLDHIDSLEYDNAELTAECARLRELATNYFEKWNALRQQDVKANAFAKALVSAIEKVSADDTAIVISEIE